MVCVESFALIWIYLYGGVWRADPERGFLSLPLYFFFIIIITVNPCPVLPAKGKDIVKAAYLGGVFWTASLSRSPRPLGDSFTVQMTLRERSMEKLKNQKSNKINYERKSVLLEWGKADLIPRRGLQRSRDGRCYTVVFVCGV